VAFGIALAVQLPALLAPDLADEDLRFFYWLHRIADKTLFRDDPVLDYQIVEWHVAGMRITINKVSLGYGLFYQLVSWAIPPILFSKLLVFPLILVSVYSLYHIGVKVVSPIGSSFLCVVFSLVALIPQSSTSLSNGLPRSFAIPLLLAMIHALMNRRYLVAVPVLIFSIIYPPVFVLNVGFLVVHIAFSSLRHRRLIVDRRQASMLLAAVLFSALLLLPAVTTGLNTSPVGSTHLPEQSILASPLYGKSGRYPLFEAGLLTGNGGLLDRGLIGVFTLFWILLVIIVTLVFGFEASSIPSTLWHLLWASGFCYVASWLPILFTSSASLHMPNRYTRASLFLVSLVFLFTRLRDVLHRLEERFVTSRAGRDVPGDPPLRSRILNAAMASLFMLMPMVYLPYSSSFFHRPPERIAPLIAFLRTLPKDALLAGHPHTLDDVPLYARRAVLFSHQVESRDFDLMVAALDAYYAESGGEVVDFCQENDVDFLVVEERAYSEQYLEQGHFLFEPVDSYLAARLEGREAFALRQVPDELKVFQTDTLFVIPCDSRLRGIGE
jgi:hypothetical protein